MIIKQLRTWKGIDTVTANKKKGGIGMQKYFAVISLALLIFMVLIRAAIMKKREGIRAFVFGKTDKKDFIILPFALLFFYQILANAFGWPKVFGQTVSRFLFHSDVIGNIGVALCILGLTVFLISIISFGKSFRVGVDAQKPDKLVTTGIFAISRNPIYIAFGAELLGLLLIIPTLLSLFYLIAGILMFHRQILIEEAFLKNYYGKEYKEYCQKVRRYF